MRRKRGKGKGGAGRLLTTLILVGNLDGSGIGGVLNWRHFWFGLVGSLKTEKIVVVFECLCNLCLKIR